MSSKKNKIIPTYDYIREIISKLKKKITFTMKNCGKTYVPRVVTLTLPYYLNTLIFLYF